MPTPESGEGREEYMQRCMVHADTQKWDEKQRAAVCEHMYDEHSKRSEQMTTTNGQERFEQFTLAVDSDRIDREAGILRGVKIMGLRSRHGYDFDPAGVAANRPRFEGMAVGIDHDYKAGPLTLDHTWGTMRDVDATGTRGDLHFNKAHPRTEQLLESIERELGPVALSPVYEQFTEENRGGKRVVTSFVAKRLDVVVGAATTRTMFEQAGGQPQSADVGQLRAELASVRQEISDLKARQAVATEPRQRMEQHIDRIEKTVDLKKFWND